MSTKYNRLISLVYIFILIATFCTISQSYVEGFPSLDKNSFGLKPKGTVKTIEALDCGDIIDCVDIYKQPAFDNPLIKDLKMDPSSYLSGFNKTRDRQPQLIQTWRKYGECPKGTVPIRRTLDKNGTIHRKILDDPKKHEYATVHQYFNKGQGGKATFNVWKPVVETPYEFSLAQVWAVSGKNEHLNTVEAGWMVLPSLFHDERTRLFTYWTSDGYEKTGCYNLLCNGFVQTNFEIALGGAVEPISVYNGQQITLIIALSTGAGGDWWLQVNDDLIGYFPRKIFTTLGDGADEISFGGEIINLRKNKRHTSTTMGSGHFSSQGFKKSSFVSNIKVAKNRYEWVEPNLRVEGITNPGCYDLTLGPSGTVLGSHFYYGGPGFSLRCK